MIATTGFFDGVHLGHQALLHRVVQLAHQQGKKSAVITFRPHPREVLHHQKIPLLTSLKEKKKLIAAQGIDQIFVLPFTEVFAQLSAQQFFQTYLVNQFHITTLVIGHNHHIGKERADFSEIQRIGTAMGITVEGIEDVKKSGTLISSTQLRKKALRQKLLAQRSLIPPKQWETRTQSITQSVISLPLFKEAPEIYCYLDYHQEVGTRAIIQKAWEEGKKVAVPKISEGKMEFHYIQTFDEVETGYKGIQEPKKADRACEKQALVIMPTVGADTSCNRIGYGKGYYDTYLATHPEYQTLALAFDMQIVAYLPVERFDKKPQILITETKTYFAPL